MVLVQLWILLIKTLVIFQLVKGSSLPPSKLSKIDTITEPTITIISAAALSYSKRNNHQKVSHADNILLEFKAFDKLISLNLLPNADLFHPDAEITIFNNSKSISVEKLTPQEYLVFKGYTNNDKSQWARILLRNDLLEHSSLPHQASSLVFEGAFTLDSDTYHIKTTSNYHLSKRHDDPIAATTMAQGMIIYRDSDQEQTISSHQQPHELTKRRKHKSPEVMCSMEEMAYNRRMTGTHAAPVAPILSGTNPNSTNQSLVGFTGLWEKRSSDSMLDPEFLLSTANSNSAGVAFANTQGCPSTRKIAYMGAAADCSYVLSYGSIRYAKLQMINDWNVASAVYERTFNVTLGLIYLQISVPECPANPNQSNIVWNQPCSNSYTINDRLSDFSLWRGSRGDDGAALWHLMTQCATGVRVGIAWLSQLCETQVSQQVEDDGTYEWVSGTGISSITRDEWKVVAHEVGHGFGAIHDCTPHMCPCDGECSCCPLSDTVCSAGNTYLMNPTSNVTTDDFSPCSISDICGTLPNIGYCLQYPDIRTGGAFSLCGNGILEPGEECDVGLTDTPCCYAKTCKLKPGAICDDYSNQCCLNCNLAPKDTICRPSVSECDQTEFCNGTSSSCPPDLYSKDGSSCANGTMECASGICTSRDQQCMAIGLRQNISQACSFQQDSCSISCADPKNSKNCLMLSGIFLDGTECGLAGFCEKGICVGTGASNAIKAWTEKNKPLAITVYVFGSIIILSILGWAIWWCFRKRKYKKDKNSRPASIASYTQQYKDLLIRNSLKRGSQVKPYPASSTQHHVSIVSTFNDTLNNNKRSSSSTIKTTTTTNTTATATANNHNHMYNNSDNNRTSQFNDNIELATLSSSSISSFSTHNEHNNAASRNHIKEDALYSSSVLNYSNPFILPEEKEYNTHRRGKSNV